MTLAKLMSYGTCIGVVALDDENEVIDVISMDNNKELTVDMVYDMLFNETAMISH